MINKISTNKKLIQKILSRGVEEVIIKESLEKKLLSGEKLRIKFGIDPTGSVLHLGHAVILKKLKEFQALGHQVIFLIGDFTAQIGDPTGKSKTRQIMSETEIKANMRNYIEQAGIILDIAKIEIRYNSEWLEKMNFAEVLSLASRVTYAQIAQRADFKERIKNDKDLSLQEFMYPVMQGYDSVMLKADVEIGGTDQKFNLLMGRRLQKRYGQAEQDVITCPILEGLDGVEKMSKSLDNYIGLTEKAEDIYGKVMSIPDSLIIKYFSLCANVSTQEIDRMEKELKENKANPRDLKMKLAFEIVNMIYGEEAAKMAQDYFIKTVQKKEIPSEVESRKLKVKSIGIIDLLIETGLASSKSEARRLIQQNGIKIDEEVVTDPNQEIKLSKEGVLVQRGKRQFVRARK